MRTHPVRRLSLSLLFLAALPSAAHAADRGYVVQLKAPPLAAYDGGMAGLPATSPQATGQRIATKSSAASKYKSYLAGKQSAALDRVPGPAPAVFYSYRTAFAGFAARLTPDQVTALRHAPEVAHVFLDGKMHVDDTPTDAQLGGQMTPKVQDSASYLGLSETGGLWDKLGGYDAAGDGEVIADIDTGITPQHPSFSPDPSGGAYMGSAFGPPPSTWHGTCEPGADATEGPAQDPAKTDPSLVWTKSTCNNKLVGARWYVDGFGLEHLNKKSFVSARDDDGHGSHTSSTAAGNFGVNPSIFGSDLNVDLISGIAPRARIAEYKVCWSGGDVADGCTNSDSVAAIDDAVSDGADVINYSVGSSDSAVIGAVEYAYLGASDAGVFVANSAGNDGPDEGTVGSPAAVPWLTAVAAGSTTRSFEATATITPSAGAAFTITGTSLTKALTSATTLADAATSVLSGATAANAGLCMMNSLDPAKVTGKVVLCMRGGNDRIEKSQNVKKAGGVGMILYNANDGQELDTDEHFVPSVQVSNSDGLKVKKAIAAGTSKATLTAGTAVHSTGGVLAAFSSRGPQTAVPDIAKPDLEAPGVNILDANSPNPAVADLPSGQLFQSISGTSMASPHVAGAGALVRQAHPNWDPAEVKSALMTTANPAVMAEDGKTRANPFQTGSGQIDPTAAAGASLVLDLGTNDYVRYVDSIDPTIFGDDQTPIAPSDLNLPSISNSAVPGAFSTSRTFTSTDSATRRWTASISVPGFDAFAYQGAAQLSSFSIAPGGKETLQIQAERTTAPLGQYAYGALTLTSGDETLRIPVSLQPIALKAPTTIAVKTDQAAGEQDVPLTSGFTGTLTGSAYGLAAPHVNAAQTVIASASGSPDPSGAEAGNKTFDVTVPAGAKLISGRISNVDDGSPNTDLDLYLYQDANGDGKFTADELYDQSASGVATEAITDTDPPAGKYRFVVVGFTTMDPSTFDFTTWVQDGGKPDDLAAAPGLALTGDPFAVETSVDLTAPLQWAGVGPAGLYLGTVDFSSGGADPVASAVVELTKTVDSATGPTGPTAATGPTGTSGPTLPTGPTGPVTTTTTTTPTETTPPTDTTPPPTDTTTTPEGPPVPPVITPAPVRLSLRLSAKTSLKGKTLKLGVTLKQSASVGVSIKRGTRIVTRAKTKKLKHGSRKVSFTLVKTLKPGKYTIAVRATSGSLKPVIVKLKLTVR